MDRPASSMSLWSESLNFVMFILLLVLSVDSRYSGSWLVKLAKEGYFLSFECVDLDCIFICILSGVSFLLA